MRRRIQKATNSLREHLLGSGHRNSMKIPRKHILVVEGDDNSVEILRSVSRPLHESSNGRRHLRGRSAVGEDRAGWISICSATVAKPEAPLNSAEKFARWIRTLPSFFALAQCLPGRLSARMSAGAPAYLTKPCELQELRQTIRCLIAGAGARGRGVAAGAD